jgi:hypothetical protein
MGVVIRNVFGSRRSLIVRLEALVGQLEIVPDPGPLIAQLVSSAPQDLQDSPIVGDLRHNAKTTESTETLRI